jgi:hypothetical protein
MRLDGGITAQPGVHVADRPVDNGAGQVFSRGADGALWQGFWTSTSGWQWQDLAGAIT